MGVKIKDLAADVSLSLKCIAGRGALKREVETSQIQKPGLLLTGLLKEIVHHERIQILGAAEIGYLKALKGKNLEETLEIFTKPAVPGFIVTRGLKPPAGLVRFCKKASIALLSSPLTSSILIERLIRHLEKKLAPSVIIHGVLVDVLGIGMLLKGKSGIGKSECALDLVSRGYRLVADDVVVVKRIYPSTLIGNATDRIPYHLEVRGIGIVNVKDLFGITAIRENKQIDTVVELVEWNPAGEYERLGFKEKKTEILGVELPYLTLPVSPGRSMATIVEVSARNQILKIMGYRPGRELKRRLAIKKGR